VNTKYKHNLPVFDGKVLIPAGQAFSYEGTPGREWEVIEDVKPEKAVKPEKG
jgi:hypothetical protein